MTVLAPRRTLSGAIRTTFMVSMLALGLSACGSSRQDLRDISVSTTSAPATTAAAEATTAPAAPATTTARPTSAGRSCVAVLADGLKLSRDYSREVRGIAGADEASYRARAQALVDEARRLGCQIPPGVEDFLQ